MSKIRKQPFLEFFFFLVSAIMQCQNSEKLAFRKNPRNFEPDFKQIEELLYFQLKVPRKR